MEQKTRKMLMAIAGAYLVYVGGSLIYSVLQTRPENLIIFLLAGAVFVIVGVLTAIGNFKAFLNEAKKDLALYDDADESEEDTQEER